MKKHLLFLYCIMAVISLFIMPGCVPKDNSITVKIGIALGNNQNSWNAAAGIYASSQSAGHHLPYFLGNSTDNSLQYTLLERMITAECQAIVLAPDHMLETTIVSDYINRGIPIILFEQSMDVDYTLLVKGDHAATGRMAADFVMETLSGSDPNILILKAPGSPYNTRIDAFAAGITGGTVTEQEVDAATVARGTSAIQSLLGRETPPDYNVIYTADDDLVCGVIEALAAEGVTYRPAVIVGCGGSQALVKLMAGMVEESDSEAEVSLAIPDGITVGTVFYPPVFIRDAVEAAARLVLSGEAPAAREINAPAPVLVTSGNATEYIDPESLY